MHCLAANNSRLSQKSWYPLNVCVRRWQSLNGLICEKAKALPISLAKVPTLRRIAVGRNLEFGGVMREGRCCDHGNFPRTRLSGSRLSWPKLAKARSGLVSTFHRWEEKLGVSFVLSKVVGCTIVQGCWMLPGSPGYCRQMFCCNPNWHVGSWSRQRTDWGVGTSWWSLVWMASVEICRRWWSFILRRLRTTSLIILETDRPVTIPTAHGQTWQGCDSCSGLTQLVKSWESLACLQLCSGSPVGRWWKHICLFL